MNRWIVPCNINKYDVVNAFAKLPEIDWLQRLNDVKTGDHVYIYIGVPVSEIKYICEVVKTNMTTFNADLIDDGEFIIDKELENRDSKKYMRLRLLREVEDGVLSLQVLRDHGVAGNIQSGRFMPPELEELIENLENEDKSALSQKWQIDFTRLHELEKAFVWYELAKHEVDPRKTLEGTTLRIYEDEGYKQYIYDKSHERIKKGGPYVDIVRDSLNDNDNNLVEFHQKLKMGNLLESDDRDLCEAALSTLYDGNDDGFAFKDVVDVFGGNFDVIGLLYFIKDGEKYLPIRSGLFDKRFQILHIDAGLAGNCTWKKYQEYNEAIKAIQEDLVKNVNKDITLIDAHSFVWILDWIKKYDNSVQLVEHETLGIGEIVKRSPYELDDEKITVKYAKGKKVDYLRSLTIDVGKLKLLEPQFDIDGPNETKQDLELKKALEQVDTAESRKYIVLQSSKDGYKTGTVRSPYYDYSGKKRYYWDTLSELKPGDILFNYNGGIIKAVGIVTSHCYDIPISELQDETEGWGDTRRQVDYKPYAIENIVDISDYKNEIIKYSRDKNSAFDKNGGVNRGYVYELEPEIAALFEKAIGIDTASSKKEKEAHIAGTFYSWTIKNENTAIKQCDKSVFEYRGSTIPKEVHWFFNAENIGAGEKKNISLEYGKKEYSANMQREVHELGRIRLFWEKELADEFEDYYTPAHFPNIVFEKVADDYYKLHIDTEKTAIDSEVEELLDETIDDGKESRRVDVAELQKQEVTNEHLRQKQRDDEYPKRFAKDIGIKTEDWIELINNNDIFREYDIELVKSIYIEDNHATTLYDLSIKEGVSSNSYIFPVVYLGKRISKAMQLEPIYRSDGTRAWWRVPFWGRKREDGHFEWKLRPELAKALSIIYPELDTLTVNEEEDDQLVSDLKQSAMSDVPSDFEYSGGEKEKPTPVFTNGHKTYPRDRQTAINALAHAHFKCEFDGAHPTFIRRNSDKPYTEPHHLVPMAFSDRFNVSLDREENIVSLCSNCHNEIHYGRDARVLIEKLYDDRIELLGSIGVDITLEELLKMYNV